MEKSFAEVTLPFGDDDYKFAMSWKDADEWERQQNRSLFQTFTEMVATRTSTLAVVRSVAHVGLVGGGKTPDEATKLVRRWVENRPLMETQPVALAIMEAFLYGNDEYQAQNAADGAGDGTA